MLMKVAFVGAGAVNFGGAEGPWDHATRLERFPGIEMVGLADPLTDKAKEVVQRRREGRYGHIYANCQVYDSPFAMLEKCKMDVVFIGIPPVYRGSLEQNKQIELAFIKRGVHCFVEKPLSVAPVPRFESYAAEIDKFRQQTESIVSVGYMFRYHPAVAKMHEIMRQHGGPVMALNARYYLAYTEMDHAFWWNIDKSGGPIVEQATHFCDLARYFGGDIDLDSVQVTTLPAAHPTAQLGGVRPGMEEGLAATQKPPRVTAAQWRFENGGVGSLMHVIALHGKNYETHFDVIMDGLRMTLYEPYHETCKLLVRRSGSEVDEVLHYPHADMYNEEVKAFLEAASSRNAHPIKSTYADACKTYKFTCKIRELSKK